MIAYVVEAVVLHVALATGCVPPPALLRRKLQPDQVFGSPKSRLPEAEMADWESDILSREATVNPVPHVGPSCSPGYFLRYSLEV